MKELYVELLGSSNKFVPTPCFGKLELFEIGTDGSIIIGVWRMKLSNGTFAAPVEVRNVEFNYR